MRLLETKTMAAPPANETKRALARFEIKADSIDEGSRTFSGLAATWDLDLGGDVIHRGAFKKTLNDWRKSRKPLPLLDSHSAWSSIRAVVGKLKEAEETEAGLEATFAVMDGPDGDEIWRRIKGGYVSGLSIGYRAIKTEAPTDEEARTGIFRHLKEVRLEEISVCVWPMNPDARIDADSMKAALAGMSEQQRAEFRALLEPEPKQEAAPPEEAAHDGSLDAYKARLRLLKLRQAGTRASA